jgi:hypothetical protein
MVCPLHASFVIPGIAPYIYPAESMKWVGDRAGWVKSSGHPTLIHFLLEQ